MLEIHVSEYVAQQLLEKLFICFNVPFTFKIYSKANFCIANNCYIDKKTHITFKY